SDNRTFTAIQSGLSDYLPCSFNGEPLFGVKAAPVFARLSGGQVGADGYTRRMTNAARIDGEVTEYTVHAVGEGWSGAFWELRGLIGDRATDGVVLQAWKAADVIADTPQG